MIGKRLLAVLLCACASPALAAETTMSKSAPSVADAAYMRSMDAMMKSMDAPMSGDPDKDFVTMMLPHHEAAVEMAKVQLRYGKDPVLRAMAQDVIASQGREIEAMKRWQAEHAK